uniref:MAM domain-containing protein n=1 Tax=Strigamia maritima TaxID=126957 RepID=T1ITU1_STRMM
MKALLLVAILNFPLVLSQETGIDCKFNNYSLCGWQQDQTDNFDWLPYCKDDDIQNCLVYIESTSPHRANEQSRLVSPNIVPNSQTQCFSFSYHMFGVRVNSLNIYIKKSDGQSQLIWHRKHSRANIWHRGYRTIESSTEYKIIIEAVAGHPVNSIKSDGIIAVQSTELIEGICAPLLQQADYYCDFEEDFCMWYSGSNWMRNTSLNIALPHKPAKDYTTGTDNGYFAYISTDEDKTSISTNFSSPKLTTTSEERCVQFYYYMERGTRAQIDVYIVYEDREFQLLCSQMGVEDNYWAFAEVAVTDHKKQNHWVKIIITRGETVVEAAYNMPEFDISHTDAGYFLFVDLANAQPNQKATLSSKPINPCPVCLTFEYFTQGENFDGKLEILIKNWSGERIQATISHVTNDWTKHTQSISQDCGFKPYEIYIRATAGNGKGFIAIDNLSTKVTSDDCKTTPPIDTKTSSTAHHKVTTRPTTPSLTATTTSFAATTTTLAATTTTLPDTTLSLKYTPILTQNKCDNGTLDCGDGSCILAIYLCDGVKDCHNNADELTCALTCQDRKSNSYCEGFNWPQCLSNNHLCDGIADCINNADENKHLCGGCPNTYCVTGRCIPDGSKMPHCICNNDEHHGRRCEYLKPIKETPSAASPPNDYTIWIMVPMMTLLVVVIAILLINLYCYRKYKWYHAAGLLGQKNNRSLYRRNSMNTTEMTPTNVNVEEVADDVGLTEAPQRRAVREDAISMIQTPLTNYKLHSLYIGKVVLDDDGNIVAVSNA